MSGEDVGDCRLFLSWYVFVRDKSLVSFFLFLVLGLFLEKKKKMILWLVVFRVKFYVFRDSFLRIWIWGNWFLVVSNVGGWKLYILVFLMLWGC